MRYVTGVRAAPLVKYLISSRPRRHFEIFFRLQRRHTTFFRLLLKLNVEKIVLATRWELVFRKHFPETAMVVQTETQLVLVIRCTRYLAAGKVLLRTLVAESSNWMPCIMADGSIADRNVRRRRRSWNCRSHRSDDDSANWLVVPNRSNGRSFTQWHASLCCFCLSLAASRRNTKDTNWSTGPMTNQVT